MEVRPTEKELRLSPVARAKIRIKKLVEEGTT